MSHLSRRMLLHAPLAPIALAQSRRRPNILFICSDQHAAPYLGVNGHAVVKTPHLDKLAARGVNFRNAYCGSPVCVPGRASMMSGMFASDVASYCNSTPFDGTKPTWANRLTQAGYHCWATGKLDLWQGKDLGFHEEKTNHGHSQHPDITSLFRMPLAYRQEERKNADGGFKDRPAPDQDKAERAIRFLKEQAPKLNQPWCMYVGITKPHPKFEAHTKYREMYPPAQMPLPTWPEGYLEKRHAMFQLIANFKGVQLPVPKERVQRARAAYFGLITEMDELIGSILAELERSGQADNTIVIYTSDHGEMLGEHGLWLKNLLLEGAATVPMMIAGPGIPQGKTVTTPSMHVDLVATMLAMAGVAKAPELRGHHLLDGTHPGIAYAESHSEGNATGSFLIRKGDWKYIYFTGDEPLLFHLKDDPGEFRNLAKDPKHAAVRKEMHAHLTALVDPDQVTFAAFRKQNEVLARMVKENSRQEFYDELVGRLGPLQARMLTERSYKSI